MAGRPGRTKRTSPRNVSTSEKTSIQLPIHALVKRTRSGRAWTACRLGKAGSLLPRRKNSRSASLRLACGNAARFHAPKRGEEGEVIGDLEHAARDKRCRHGAGGEH